MTNGLVTPAYCMVPPGVFGFLDDPALAEIQNFDPAAAMEALVGTEFEGGQNWPEITMWMRANEENYNADIMANDIVDQLKENLGMDVKIQPVPQSNFVRAALREHSGSWSSSAGGTTTRIRTTATATCSTAARPRASARRGRTRSSTIWSMQGKAEPDPAKRLEIYRQAEKIIQEDVGYMPLVYRLDKYVFKPWVKGVAVNQQGYVVPDGNIYVRMLTKVYVEGRRGVGPLTPQPPSARRLGEGGARRSTTTGVADWPPRFRRWLSTAPGSACDTGIAAGRERQVTRCCEEVST